MTAPSPNEQLREAVGVAQAMRHLFPRSGEQPPAPANDAGRLNLVDAIRVEIEPSDDGVNVYVGFDAESSAAGCEPPLVCIIQGPDTIAISTSELPRLMDALAALLVRALANATHDDQEEGARGG